MLAPVRLLAVVSLIAVDCRQSPSTVYIRLCGQRAVTFLAECQREAAAAVNASNGMPVFLSDS